MSNCDVYPTPEDSRRFKNNTGSTDEFVTSTNDTFTDQDGGIHNTIEGISTLAENQRDQFDATFTAQFTYARIGNISDFVGDTLTEPEKLNSYQYPDDSGNWYGPIQSQTFPITIPVDPTVAGSGWSLINGASQQWVADNYVSNNSLPGDIGTLTNYQAETIASMLEGRSIGGDVVVTPAMIDSQDISCSTQGYYGGWAATLVPGGGANYIMTTLQRVRESKGDLAWQPDGLTDHYLFGGTDYVAMLNSELTFKRGGCVMDNITDDYLPLQNLFNIGGRIIAESGVAVSSQAMEMEKYITIEGQSSDSYSSEDADSIASIIRFTSTDFGLIQRVYALNISFHNFGIEGSGSGVGWFIENGNREVAVGKMSIDNFHTGFKAGDFWFSKCTQLSINRCLTGLHFASGGTLLEMDTVILQGSPAVDMVNPIIIDGSMNSVTPPPFSTQRQQLKIRNLVMQYVAADSLVEIANDTRQLIIETAHIEASTFNYVFWFKDSSPYRMTIKLNEFYCTPDSTTISAIFRSTVDIPQGELSFMCNSIMGYDSLKFTNLYAISSSTQWSWNKLLINNTKLSGDYGLRNLVTNFDQNIWDMRNRAFIDSLRVIDFGGYTVLFEPRELISSLANVSGRNIDIPLEAIRWMQSTEETFSNGGYQTIEYKSGVHVMEYKVRIRTASTATSEDLYMTRNGAVESDPDFLISTSIVGDNLRLTFGANLSIISTLAVKLKL